MDENRKQAFAKAIKKLLESHTSEEDIIISLKEMGLDKKEAIETLEFAKKLPTKKDEAKAQESGEQKINTKESSKKNFWGSEEDGMLDSAKKEKTLVKNEEAGTAFWKKILKEEGQKEEPKKGKSNFIPELKKGGKERVKEIIVESPLDMKNKEEKTLEQTKKLERITGKKDEKTVFENNAENETGKNAWKRISEEKNLGNSKEDSGKSAFKSSLDFIEKEVDRGTGLETAVKKAEKKKDEAENVLSKINILVIPNREYSKGISTLLKRTSENYQRIALVNLNELYKSMIQHLKELGVDVNKFFFIDAITITSDKNVKKHDNAIFVSSPNSLIELSLAITQTLNTQKPDVLIFDSLSTMLIYEDESTVTKFVHSLIGKIKAYGLDAYFTALEGDANNECVKNLSMFVDKVSTLTEFELGELGFETNFAIPERTSNIENVQKTSVRPKPMDPELLKRLGENRIVTTEMNRLKEKLNDMQENREVEKSLNELKGQMSKIDELKNLREQVKQISEKIGKKEETSMDKSIVMQINRLEKKIDESSDKKAEGNEKYREEIKKSMQDIKEKMGKIEKLSGLQEQVKALSEKVEQKKEKPIDSAVVEQITKLASKIDGIEKTVSTKLREKKSEQENESLKKKLESYKKQAELQSMMNDFYKTDISKVNPDKVMTKHLEKDLEKKEKFLDTAYKKGLVPKQVFTKGRNRIKQESKRLKHAAMVHSLEGKLDTLNEAYDSGVISRDSYTKGKVRIEKLLKT